MKTLHISVADKIATYQKRDGDIVCGNSDYQIEFTFDSEWDAYTKKTARFKWGGEHYDKVFSGNVCPVPIIRNTDKVEVGVFVEDLETTTSAEIGCRRSILCGSSTPSTENDIDYANEAKESADRAETAAKEAEAVVKNIELPQEWVDINEAYEAIGEDNHKLKGGAIYKDFEGNIQVFPLAPPYGIRTDEVGEKYAQSSIAMYNSTQQLMVKPATDGRHTVSAAQLARIFGSGRDTTNEKSFDLNGVKLPTAQEYGYGYCFARNPYNTFTVKGYSDEIKSGMLVARDDDGNFQVPEPTKADNPVGLGYLNEIFGGSNDPDGTLSIKKLPAATGIDDCYCFARDSDNKFTRKFYSAPVKASTLVARDDDGNFFVNEPTHDFHPVNLGYANKKFLSKSGGVLSGKLTSKTTNPYFSLIDTQDNSSQSYVQAYRGKTYMGYSVAKSISVDKEGNAGVVGGLTVGGSISCGEPKEDTDAVTLGYVNEKIAILEKRIKDLETQVIQ